jgi:predicted DNA-binding transcriptional regulator YafY
MNILRYACLDEVRRAIQTRSLLSFTYRKERVRVEPHLLGNARKTRALILCGWRYAPAEGWEYFRFAEIRDLELLEDHFLQPREDFNPHDRRIAGIDTAVR